MGAARRVIRERAKLRDSFLSAERYSDELTDPNYATFRELELRSDPERGRIRPKHQWLYEKKRKAAERRSRRTKVAGTAPSNPPSISRAHCMT